VIPEHVFEPRAAFLIRHTMLPVFDATMLLAVLQGQWPACDIRLHPRPGQRPARSSRIDLAAAAVEPLVEEARRPFIIAQADAGEDWAIRHRLCGSFALPGVSSRGTRLLRGGSLPRPKGGNPPGAALPPVGRPRACRQRVPLQRATMIAPARTDRGRHPCVECAYCRAKP